MKKNLILLLHLIFIYNLPAEGRTTINEIVDHDLFVASFKPETKINGIKILECSSDEYMTGIIRETSGNIIISVNFSGKL